jgi:orotidine-5'-phosphate decarboxylase
VSRPSNRLIAALDTADLDQLSRLARALGPHVGLLKVGLEAFVSHGPAAVREAAQHAPVFCDLKLHDIPNTVKGTARAASRLGIAMLTVHASGGAAMVAAAVEAAPDIAILGVTVLTSLDTAAEAPRLAALAVHAGARGVVCAAPDIAAVREAVGPGTAIVVPGIRPPGADPGDQARVATPRAAIEAGADYLVVGRPLTASPDPAAAARAILDQIP